MVTSWTNSRKTCRSLLSRFSRLDGRHVGTRTPDLYRVNFEVNNLKPFACLAFPHTTYLKTPRKQPIFGDELVTSFLQINLPNRIFCENGFGTRRGHATNACYGLKECPEPKRNIFCPVSVRSGIFLESELN